MVVDWSQPVMSSIRSIKVEWKLSAKKGSRVFFCPLDSKLRPIQSMIVVVIIEAFEYVYVSFSPYTANFLPSRGNL